MAIARCHESYYAVASMFRRTESMTTGSPRAASTSSMNGSRRRSGSLHRAGDAIVAGAVPLAYWHTSVRYHVLMRGVPASGGPGAPTPAPASSAITRESCPPCQAIGERAGGPASSTTSSAPGIVAA